MLTLTVTKFYIYFTHQHPFFFIDFCIFLYLFVIYVITVLLRWHPHFPSWINPWLILLIITEDLIGSKSRLPDELLERGHHSLGLGRDVGGLGWPHHGAGAPLVLPQAEPNGLVLAICTHGDQELALVSVFRLQVHRTRSRTWIWMGFMWCGARNEERIHSKIIHKYARDNTTILHCSIVVCYTTAE